MCRYFGGDWDDWDRKLTIRRLKIYREQLRLEPPPEWFLAGFFGYKPAPLGPEVPQVESPLQEYEE